MSLRRRTPLQTRTRLRTVNPERKAHLADVQYGPPDFVLWLHRLPCSVPGCEARDVEQAHAKSRAAGGAWTDSLPLCREHHRGQHLLGLLTWERKHGLDLSSVAAEVQRAWRER